MKEALADRDIETALTGKKRPSKFLVWVKRLFLASALVAVGTIAAYGTRYVTDQIIIDACLGSGTYQPLNRGYTIQCSSERTQ